MKRPIWALSWLVVLTLIVGYSLAEPRIVTPPGVVIVPTGQTSTIQCRIADLGENAVIWRRVDHDFVISENRQIVTDGLRKFSILPGQERDQSFFDLMILGTQPSDQGFYECKVNGTDQAVIMHLDVSDADNFDTSYEPRTDMNVTACCQNEGVSLDCLPACVPDPIDLDTFNPLTQCGSMEDLMGLSHCFSDGSNHDVCCLASGVDPMCLPFCHDAVASATLTTDHMITCLTDEQINRIFDCFAVGSDLLPGPPTEFTAIYVYDARKINTILLKWSPPNKNPDKVSGYIILYKTGADNHFKSIPLPPSAGHHYRLDEDGAGLTANTQYQIYIVATADHGGSLGSVELSVFVGDGSQVASQEVDIDACCGRRGVSDKCRDTLCRSKTWSHFDTEEVLSCSSYMEDVFSCLTGETNHTLCCSSYGVSQECLPLCSGEPPKFDDSLLKCVLDMSVVEACVQQGNDKLPLPPTSLSLYDISSMSAVVSFQPSTSQDVQSYIVQVSQGEDSKAFSDKQTLPTSAIMAYLDNLQPDTYYNVRIVTETSLYNSLPSETVSFLTYPASIGAPTVPPVVNQPVDMMECCESKGMPELCWRGCVYRVNITSYYYDKLDTCMDHIGSVLSCAADGRDHSSCCIRNKIDPPHCVELCTMSRTGAIPKSLHSCVATTSTAILCYMEGLMDLPRHPDLQVTNVTSRTIKVEWDHPSTSSLIEDYIVQCNLKGDNETKSETTTDTVYTLQDLLPGAAYEISARSVNENGTSIASPKLTVFTLAVIEIPSTNTTAPTGRALWSSIEDCCDNSSLSPACVDICKNSASAEDVTRTDECLQDDHKMLACFNDGQDHSVCCKRANLVEECLPLCAGHTTEQSVIASSCLSYGHRQIILGCILENQDLVPGTPKNFIVKVKDQGAVDLSWADPKSCAADCIFTVYYWEEGSPQNVTEKRKVRSPLTIDKLTVNKFYVFTVSGQNRYGAGAPAPWETLFVFDVRRDVSVTFSSNEVFVEKGSNVRLTCKTIGFVEDYIQSYQWTYNSRVLEGETEKYLKLYKVTPEENEGHYTCTVTDHIGMSSDTTYLNMQYEPMVSNVLGVPGYTGLTSRIECWFKGSPDQGLDTWLLNGQSIDTTSVKRMRMVEDDYGMGITKYKLTVRFMKEEDYGEYKVIARNKFGQSPCTVKIQNPETATTLPPQAKSPDTLQCCKDKGVNGICLDLCDYDLDIAEALNDSNYTQCLFVMTSLLQCGADGRDHSKCCQTKGVPPDCFPFCAGNVPENFDLEKQMVCALQGVTILQCAKEGHDLIPYAPTITTLTKGVDPRTIVVRWQPPKFNRHYVKFYKIYHKSTNPNVQSVTHTVNEHIMEYEIGDLITGLKYSIYLTAGNQHGESFPSEEFEYTAPSTGQQGPQNLAAKNIGSSTVVRLTWSRPMYTSIYEVHYREIQSTTYDIETTENLVIELRNLKPGQHYLAYVVAIHDGKPSDPSEVVSFSIPKTAVDRPSGLTYSLIPGTSSVRLAWQGSHGVTYKVYYKTGQATSYSHITTKNTYQIISNLRPNTQYLTYIEAYTTDGAESAQSSRISFRTGSSKGETSGQSSDDDNGKKVAVGIGVTLLVVAIIAIILIIIFFIYKKRMRNSPRMGSETVTFENPGYGAPGSVKLGDADEESFNYGRLQEDRDTHHYDNPAAQAPWESSTDTPTYNNTPNSQHDGGGQQAATLDVDSP